MCLFILLQEANLSDVLMDRAVMNEANLKSAILQRAVFTRSDLGGANVEGADFTNALLDKTQQMVSSPNMRLQSNMLLVSCMLVMAKPWLIVPVGYSSMF
eukprot:GHUV01020447.1.p4 GENE.GHUV01020447.1~~GHUV01020447.1.p4  ORF type:complete len:100 (-),score=26.00 GHUV01020447.1:450-749(-)